MNPPWPNTTLNFGRAVRFVVFSPSESHLAFAHYARAHDVVHVWDRWGKEALLVGHTRRIINCLEYSSDEEYLASGCQDGSIRLWHTESFHTASSQISSERPTRRPKQADIILGGTPRGDVTALSFSRTDPNLLVSGGSDGEIKVWNVKEQACIHAFNSRLSYIRSLSFTGGADSACVAVASTGSIIRFWKAEGSSDFESETIGEEAVGPSVLSPSGSFLATSSYSCADSASTLRLYELETMTKTQSIVMPGMRASCFAMSPDSKQLVFSDYRGNIRLLQTDDFSLQRDLHPREESSSRSVTFDPTCRVLACGHLDGTLELRCL